MSVPVLESKQDEALSAFVECWQQGEGTRAREFLSRHSDLPPEKSLVLDLALEEFCQRRAKGETVVPSTFCNDFPAYRRSVRRLIDVRVHLSANPEFLKQIPDIHWPSCGTRFLDFDLLKGLGLGAFARVYLAKQEAFGGRLVALKVAWQGEGEVRTLGRLAHANIVPAYSLSVDEQSGLTAVCMPFLGRATLTDLLDAAFVTQDCPTTAEIILRVAEDADALPTGNDTALIERRLSPRETYVEGAAHLVRQLAEALDCVHTAGFLHRDLKPSNVLLTSGGVPRLLDFNLSVHATDRNAAVGGTLPYMAPELLRWVRGERTNESVLNDPRTDIFSLGVMLFELLTGSLPFGDPEPGIPLPDGTGQLLAAQEAGVPSAASRNPRVEPDIDKIIARCVASDPNLRYARASDLARDLRKYLSPQRRRSRWLRDNRRGFLTVGAACCFAAGALGIWYATKEPPPVPLSDLEQGFLEYDRGRFDVAFVCFDRHLAAQPTDPEGLFARGQASRALGNMEAAEDDYTRAARHSSSGEIRACIAFCMAKAGRHSRAVEHGLAAIEGGYDTAILRNNLGHAQGNTGYLSKALENLDRAVELDGDLYAARHNRAKIGLRLAFEKSQPPDPQTLKDIDHALRLGKPNTQLLADAAAIYGLASQTDPTRLERAAELLRTALQLGFPSIRAQTDRAFEKSRLTPQVQLLLESSTPVPAQTKSELLVLPPGNARLQKS